MLVGSYTRSAVVATLGERCGIFVEVQLRPPSPAALSRVAAVPDARLQYATCAGKNLGLNNGRLMLFVELINYSLVSALSEERHPQPYVIAFSSSCSALTS